MATTRGEAAPNPWIKRAAKRAVNEWAAMAATVPIRKMPKPAAWSFYAVKRRFKLDDRAAKRVICWGWRDLPSIPPDDDAARWLRADLQRSRIAGKYSRRRGDAHA